MSGSYKHKRVLFLGGESSGKTTITKAAANLFKSQYAIEYGRTHGEDNGNQYSYEDMGKIALQQMKIEQAVLENSYYNPFSFYDTSLLVTYFYSMEWFNKSPESLKTLALKILSTYDYVFVCMNDIPFVQDGTRQSLAFSEKQRLFYEYVLEKCGISFVRLNGSVEERLNTIVNELKKHHEQI